jgi:predicted ATPase
VITVETRQDGSTLSTKASLGISNKSSRLAAFYEEKRKEKERVQKNFRGTTWIQQLRQKF